MGGPPHAMDDVRLVDVSSDRLIVEHLAVADRFWRIFVGLQFRRTLPAGSGLLLVPCSSVHTFCMRFSIDIVGLNRAAEVTRVIQDVKPWRVAAMPRGTYAILELPAGAARSMRTGDKLRIVGGNPRASLEFLRSAPSLPA